MIHRVYINVLFFLAAWPSLGSSFQVSQFRYTSRVTSFVPDFPRVGQRFLAEDITSLETDDNSGGNVETEKEQLSKAYNVGQYLFGSLAAVLLLMPDRTHTIRLASKCGGAAGFGVAAVLSYILKGANEHNRLNSDTYKRLNLGLLAFSAIGILAFPGEAAFLHTAGLAMVLSALMTLVKIYGTVLAWVGWRRGANIYTAKQTINELLNGAKETFKGLKVQQKKKSLMYRNCLLLVILGIFSSVMEGLFNVRYLKALDRSWFDVSLQMSAVGRLTMLATMIYSLKDAAERDRLAGTTFIQLNVLVAGWAILVGMGQSIFPLGFAANRGTEFFAMALLFLVKAYKSLKEKSEKKQLSA